MKNISFKEIWPHLLAIGVFLLITILFFRPLLFEGRIMTQNDILQGQGAGQELREFRQETGEEGLWTNSMFGGMPGYMINVAWSGDLSRYIHQILSLNLPSPAPYPFLAMLCIYIMLLSFRVDPLIALGGGIAFGLNTFMLVSIEAGHIWKVSAIAYMPLVIAGVQLILSKRILPGIGLTALAVALQLRTNHLQISYYLFLVLLVFWITFLISSWRTGELKTFLRATLFISIGGLMGVGTQAGKIWTSLEYSPHTIRGASELEANTESTSGGLDRDYAFQWSNGIAESLTFLVPLFQGGASGENVGVNSSLADDLRAAGVDNAQIRSFVRQAPTYWGDQPFTSGPIYGGIIMVFLFVLGLLAVEGPVKWWLVAATIFGFMLSWGKNFDGFNYFMFDYFPLYNKFRAVSMALAIPLLCMPILGFLGLSKFMEQPNEKVLLRAVGVTIGSILLVLLASYMFDFSSPRDGNQQFLAQALEDQRAGMLRGSAFRSLVFAALGGALLYAGVLGKLGKPLVYGGLAFLIFVDLYTIDKNYVNEENFSRPSRSGVFAPDPADQRILNDNEHYRVLNLTVSPFQDAKTSYFHSSIGGYHGAKLRRYQDLIDYHLQNEMSFLIASLNEGRRDLSDIPVLNMLNTRYFKVGTSENAVLRNPNANGNAWFVRRVVGAESPDEAIDLLDELPLDSVAVSEQFGNRGGLSVGTIELLDYQPNRLTYRSSNSGDGIAVLSEVYYPEGWQAFIDGQETPIYRVNYILRALEIPAGDHEIEFRFRPRSYSLGNTISLVFCILSIGLVLSAVVIEVKKA